MAAKKIGIVIALDGEKQFVQQVQNANKQTSALKAEMKNLSAEFDGNANSMEYLTKKQDILTRQQSAYTDKLDAAQKGLKRAQENLDGQSKKLAELESKLGDAKKKLEAFRNANEESSDAYKEQQKEVEKLEEAVERQTFARNKEIGSIAEWTKKINVAETDLKKINRETEKNEKFLEEAKNSTDQCAKSINEYGKAVKEATPVTMTFADSVKDGFGEAIGGTGFELLAKGAELIKDTVVAGIDAAADSMIDLSSASSNLAAKTGLSETAMKKYRQVMQQIRGDNYGEDFSDVSDVMSEIIQIMGELDDSAMTNIMESAITLRDTFDMDVNKSIRAADVMMKTMGVDAEHAFDLIVTGAQNGLNRSGELVDNITEYAQLWGQAGFSAEEMFAILENGLNSGAYNLNKVNDYVKEFGNSLADGRIEDNIGSFSDKTEKLFEAWKDGGASTSDVFYSVINDLSEMTNQQEALSLASEVWSALGEDNAMQVITALDDVNTAYDNVQGAMDKLKETKFSNLQDALAGLGAAIEEKVSGPLGAAADLATELVEGVTNLINPEETEASWVQGYVDEISSANDELKNAASNRDAIVADSEAEAAKLESLGNRLITLNGITNKSVGEKAELKQIVDQLGKSIPELAAAYDDETGSLKLTSEEIGNYIESQKEAMILQATLTANQELINTLVEAQTKYNEAADAVSTAEEQIAVYESQLEALEALAEQYADDAITAEEYETALEAISSQYEGMNGASFKNIHLFLQDALEEEQEGLSGLKTEMEQYSETVEVCTDKIEQNEESAKELADTWGSMGKDAEDAGEATEDTGKKAETAANLIKKAAGALVDLSEDTEGFSEAVKEAMEKAEEAAKAGAEAQKEAAKSISDTYHGYVDEIKADLQNKISLFDKFDTSDGGEDQTVEKMTENLNSQIEAYQEYEKNLAEVRDHVGKEIAPEFMQYLESMGMEGSNTLKHIIATFEDNEPEKVKEMSDRWVEAMDMTEGIAEVNAANKLAYEMSIKEFGASEADFSTLSESVNAAVSSAAEGWKDLPEKTKAALDEVIKTAQDCGVQIPEGLANGIENGDVTPESAIEQLNGAIQGSFDGLKEVANELGLSIPENLQEGIDAGGQDAVDAFDKLVDTIAAQSNTTVMQQKGQETGSEYAEGIESTTGDAATAADAVSQAAVDVVSEKTEAFKNAGNSAAKAYVDALNAAKTQAAQAGGTLGSVAQNALMAYQNAFYNAGYYMSQGAAQGILAGQSQAVSAAIQMAKAALKAAKDELDIHSPSKKFKEDVGKQVGKGFAFGIKDSSSLAGKEARKMSSKVYTEATAWLKKYKKSQKVSVDNEKYYWKQVLKHTKEGTAAYAKTLKKLTAAEMKDDFGVSWYTTKNKKVKKDAETYYSEVYQAAQTYYEKITVKDDMSLKQQKTYWTQVRNTLKKGTQAWRDAQAQIDAIKAKIGTVSNAASVLSAYQTYYDMSEQAIVDYWDTVREKYEAGTDERLEADQKYFEAKEALNDKLVELEEDYADKISEIDSQLNDEIARLNEDYEDQLKSRADAIKNAFGLFDEFESESADGKTLLFNIKSQVAGYEDWMEQLDELESKGVLNEELIDELKEQGPEISAALHALNTLTTEELAEYNEAYLKKLELSTKQAEEDTEDLKQSVADQTETLKAQAETEKAELLKTYEQSVAQVTAGMSSSLQTLADNVKLIAEDQTTALVAAIKGEAGLKDGAAESTGSNVSNSTKADVSVTSDGLPSSSATTSSSTGSTDKILAIINSYPKRETLSSKELKEHSDLFQYIYKNYKRKPGNAMYKELADALGVTADKSPTAKQRSAILKKLKAKGYRSGGRNLLEELIWMDEDLDTIGPELLVRKSDNAILTRINPGDDVVNAETVTNMAKWAQYKPESAQEALLKIQEQIVKQQATLRSYAESLNLSGITKLNALLEHDTSSPAPSVSGDISRLENLVSSMIDIMKEFLPNLSYLEERQQIVLDSGAVVGGTVSKMSNELAMRNRRRR